jgi:hypothetical protein
MGKAIGITCERTASELRRLASSSRHANQSRRLQSLAAAPDGMTRTESAKIGGMDRRRCVTEFTASTTMFVNA